MQLSKPLRIYVAIFMAAIMTNLPYMAFAAEVVPAMIPTSAVVEQMSVSQARAKVESFMKREDFRAELIKRGVNPEEVTSRMASLNEQELRQLAT